MKSPLNKNYSPLEADGEETWEAGNKKNWVDVSNLKTIYSTDKIDSSLTKDGYDMATLGSNEEFPNRVYRKTDEVKNLSVPIGTLPTRGY